ncbi:MAG TPA: hypothetical protein VMB80_05715 [Candidatus Acidoferrum sp.]|nr:hypothetical protein [Candidatus Acidoferrum sp.]
MSAPQTAPADAARPCSPANAPVLAAVCWSTTAVLAAFLCFTQLGMMLSLMAGRVGISAAAPAALVLALLAGDILAWRSGLSPRQRLWPAGLALGAIAFALAVAAWYFDLSWDGQWYHQTAIYALARDWNPLTDPMRGFLTHLELWVRHYAKGPWYVAAAIYDTTGQIEWGKCTAPIAWAAMSLAVFAAGLDYGLRRRHAAALALVTGLNPVVWCEFTSYLVDGIMIGFLTVAVAALFSGFRRPQPVVVWAGALASAVSINAKFTGLVFLCFVFAAGGLWCLFRHRGWLRTYAGWTILTLLLGAGGLGYNPYATNYIHRGQPFYPVLGSRAYPSLTAQGREGIELYETPKNLMGRNRFIRFFYATFGRPGNQPYRREPNAQLMWPFTARPADLFYYRYHEVRVAGFGPFFSGALLLSLGLGVWLLWQPTVARGALILTALTIPASLFISLHLWWPRYGPQLWLLPIVPLAFAFYGARSRWLRWAAWLLLALLVVNAGIVAAVRMAWETDATRTLERQLTELGRSEQPIEINLRYFEIPVEERLKTWGVPYRKVSRNLRNATELKSVVEGYPGAVRYVRSNPDAGIPAK